MLGRGDERFQQSLEAMQGGAGQTWLERVLKHRIIVHTRDDQSIEGTLMEQTDDGLILRASRLLGPAGKETPIAGEAWVPRENVAFAQRDD